MKLHRVFICYLAVLAFYFFSGCANKKQEQTLNEPVAEPEQTGYVADSAQYHENTLSLDNSLLVAAPILHSVVVKNPDPNDEWTTECLKTLDKAALVNAIFDAIYSGKVGAINYETDEPFTIDEVKALELEYTRDLVGKIQFEEEWYFDAENFRMGKKVKSVMLAYELYDLNREVRGYKAGVQVMFNEQEATTVNPGEVQ